MRLAVKQTRMRRSKKKYLSHSSNCGSHERLLRLWQLPLYNGDSAVRRAELVRCLYAATASETLAELVYACNNQLDVMFVQEHVAKYQTKFEKISYTLFKFTI